MRDQILKWIEQDRDRIIGFLQEFVRAATPNPPGDTVAAMQHLRKLLDSEKVTYDIIERNSTMPNLVATTAFSHGAKHLVLNGHIDVFPVENTEAWSNEPWGGILADDAIYGRGIADMKVGTSASIFTYLYLTRLAHDLHGKLTLTIVSDEETFGPNGARHLFEVCPEAVTGTACLSGEPSSPYTVRFGEKGALWLRFVVTTPGGHGAYPHVSPNAIECAFALLQELRKITELEFIEPPEVSAALDASRQKFDKAYGKGASQLARVITMNIGTMSAGPKVNMIASRCQFEVDYRLPNGVNNADILARVDALRNTHNFTYEILMSNNPNWCEPKSELAQIVQRNAAALTGIEPAHVVASVNTDTRLWRYHNVPAVVYGPTPRGLGSFDEHVPVEEALNVIRCHAVSAFDYLRRGTHQ